jgi:hypothetical protein
LQEFETLQHIIRLTQENENPKLTQGTSPYTNKFGTTLHVHVRNAMYKLIVHFTQRTQAVHYLIAEVMYFSLHFSNTGICFFRHQLPTQISFLPVLVIPVPGVPHFWVSLVKRNQTKRALSIPHVLLTSHAALNYTGIPGLVQVTAESE